MYIYSVNIGQPQVRLRNGVEVLTGGDKLPVASAYVSTLGLADDGQADTVNHGGEDKAVCVYAFDHYAYWERMLGCSLEPGAFSENLTVEGMDENTVYIGDVFQVGTALLQVCQPRTPCAKLAGKHGEPQLAKWVADINATGFYMRVLQEGVISRGDAFTRAQTHPARISIAMVDDIIFERSRDVALMSKLVEMAEFGASGRTRFQQRLAGRAQPST